MTIPGYQSEPKGACRSHVPLRLQRDGERPRDQGAGGAPLHDVFPSVRSAGGAVVVRRSYGFRV